MKYSWEVYMLFSICQYFKVYLACYLNYSAHTDCLSSSSLLLSTFVTINTILRTVSNQLKDVKADIILDIRGSLTWNILTLNSLACSPPGADDRNSGPSDHHQFPQLSLMALNMNRVLSEWWWSITHHKRLRNPMNIIKHLCAELLLVHPASVECGWMRSYCVKQLMANLSVHREHRNAQKHTV